MLESIGINEKIAGYYLQKGLGNSVMNLFFIILKQTMGRLLKERKKLKYLLLIIYPCLHR